MTYWTMATLLIPRTGRIMTFKKSRPLLLVLVFVFSLILPTTQATAISYLNWPVARQKKWNIVTLESSKLHKMATFKLPSSGCSVQRSLGYYTQGGVVTENHYVFSYFCSDRADNNYVVFGSKTETENGYNKVVKKVKGSSWGHMNSFYYDWGTYNVNIFNQGCFKDAASVSDIKIVKLSNCKSKKSKDWGVPGVDVNGNVVSTTNSSQGRLTGQGEAMDSKYVYTVGWDSGSSTFGQLWSKKKGVNALFVFSRSPKKLVKTFYIPSPLGELEDVSLDGDGNLYLWHNFGRGKYASFYKVYRSDLNLPGETVTPNTDSSNHDSSNSGTNNNTSNNSNTNNNNSNTNNNSTNNNTNNNSNTNTNDNSNNNSSAGTATTTDGEVKTAILNSQTVEEVIQLVADTMSIGVPILGTLGITIVGIQYLTAGGDEEKVRKSKRRLLEIVIGLALFVALYAIRKFLGVSS